MTTKKPSKGGSKSRSQAPNKGAKAGAARTTKPGKPLPGWFPELNEGGAPPRGRKVRSTDAPGPAPGRKLPPAGKVIDDPCHALDHAGQHEHRHQQQIEVCRFMHGFIGPGPRQAHNAVFPAQPSADPKAPDQQ